MIGRSTVEALGLAHHLVQICVVRPCLHLRFRTGRRRTQRRARAERVSMVDRQYRLTVDHRLLTKPWFP